MQELQICFVLSLYLHLGRSLCAVSPVMLAFRACIGSSSAAGSRYTATSSRQIIRTHQQQPLQRRHLRPFYFCSKLQSNFIFSRAASSSTEFDPDEIRTRQPPRWLQRPAVLLLAFMPIFTFSLGVWQIQRLQWKLQLIDELESKLKKEPLDLPKNIE